MKKLLAVTLFAFALTAPAIAAPAPEKAPASASAVKAKGIWIDVRTPAEFAEGHLQNAVNIPVDQIVERIKSVSPNKQAPINLYCRSGRRAEVALQLLKKEGYTNVTNHGGYQDLLSKGLK